MKRLFNFLTHREYLFLSIYILFTSWKYHPSLDSASYQALKSLVREFRSLDSVYTEIYNLICVGDFYMDNHEATQQKLNPFYKRLLEGRPKGRILPNM